VLALPERKDYKNHGDDGQAQMAQCRVRLRKQVMGLVFAGRLKAGDCGEKQHALKNSGAALQKRDWIHASSFLIPFKPIMQDLVEQLHSNIMRHIATRTCCSKFWMIPEPIVVWCCKRTGQPGSV
jgi:hypothetical protein